MNFTGVYGADFGVGKREYTGRIYIGYITKANLLDNEIFVFGSNVEGRHGAGTARIAIDNFGAKYGQGHGIMGRSWGLITTDLRVKKCPSVSKDVVLSEVKKLYEYADKHPELVLKVAYTGLNTMNLSGFTNQEFADFFSSLPIPSNVWFEEQFATLLNPIN